MHLKDASSSYAMANIDTVQSKPHASVHLQLGALIEAQPIQEQVLGALVQQQPKESTLLPQRTLVPQRSQLVLTLSHGEQQTRSVIPCFGSTAYTAR
jgi:hypothetical protein